MPDTATYPPPPLCKTHDFSGWTPDGEVHCVRCGAFEFVEEAEDEEEETDGRPKTVISV